MALRDGSKYCLHASAGFDHLQTVRSQSLRSPHTASAEMALSVQASFISWICERIMQFLPRFCSAAGPGDSFKCLITSDQANIQTLWRHGEKAILDLRPTNFTKFSISFCTLWAIIFTIFDRSEVTVLQFSASAKFLGGCLCVSVNKNCDAITFDGSQPNSPIFFCVYDAQPSVIFVCGGTRPRSSREKKLKFFSKNSKTVWWAPVFNPSTFALSFT